MAAHPMPPPSPPASPAPPLRIAIIGAGIAGTCLAIGLLEQIPNLDLTVYESHNPSTSSSSSCSSPSSENAPAAPSRGAGLALHGNAIAAMDATSRSIKAAYFRSAHYMAGDADVEMGTSIVVGGGDSGDGTVVAELGRAKGRRTVHRADFIEEMLRDGRVGVRFGMRVVGLEMLEGEKKGGGKGKGKGVRARFANGEARDFDVLLAADGVHSLAREHVLGAYPCHARNTQPVNRDGWRCFNALIPMREAEKALPRRNIDTVRMICTPIGYVNGLPVDRGQTYSLLATHNPRESWQILDHDPAPTYIRGRVALLGDAAHATAPHAGNGAAQAIEDAAVLTGVFAAWASQHHHCGNGEDDGIDAALRAYDSVRRPRSQRVVEITREFGRLYSLDVAERDVQEMQKRLREGGMYTNGVDMGEQVRKAVERFEEERKKGNE
ncbi:FAD/NAD(P)-binding domain-containing protein [Camillea tinctor]|nr:FAD/NAD(P)-binding domain-containing protein [Camillea tinctor]